MQTSYILLGIIGLLVIALIIVFNSLVTLRNRFRNAFAQIDVQLKRRYDLIPNLVETAKAYLKHERQTLEAVIAARNQALTASNQAAAAPGEPGAMKGLMAAESLLGASMVKLLAIVENYPDLKANTTMMQLSEELSSTENRVAFARQAYNDAIMEYNTAREKFPGFLVAGPLSFGPAQHYEVEAPGERQSVKVSFG